MKTKDVPQDDDNLLEGRITEVQYAVNENGQYTKVGSSGWKTKTIANQQAWEEENKKIDTALKLVLEGEKSPIYYYMYKCLMDVKILSKYTGLPKFRVRSHFKPEKFKSLSDKILEKYVYAFGLNSKSELKNFNGNKD